MYRIDPKYSNCFISYSGSFYYLLLSKNVGRVANSVAQDSTPRSEASYLGLHYFLGYFRPNT